MATPKAYAEWGQANGLEPVEFSDLTANIAMHYGLVRYEMRNGGAHSTIIQFAATAANVLPVETRTVCSWRGAAACCLSRTGVSWHVWTLLVWPLRLYIYISRLVGQLYFTGLAKWLLHWSFLDFSVATFCSVRSTVLWVVCSIGGSMC